MQITEKIRDKIILHLPKGYANTVAKATGYSEPTVYRVLHHGQENETVARALIALSKKSKKRHQRLIEQL